MQAKTKEIYPNFDIFGCQLFDFTQQPVPESLEKRWASWDDNVLEEQFAQVHVRLVDGVQQHLVNAVALVTNQVRLEQNLGSTETSLSNLEGLTSTVGYIYSHYSMWQSSDNIGSWGNKWGWDETSGAW